MDAFTIIYTLLGGLGIFFYGMKSMSDSLQMAAGDVITKIINSLTTNRVMALLVGTGVTMLVQSSSVTTVMVVGLVNAGLMKLTQAIGVIFGSNIGTTITGWIISIKIGKYGLLLIGLGIFPALFSKNSKINTAAKILFSVGLVFFGLEIMSGAFKPLRGNPDFLRMVAYFSEPNYFSYLASVMMGCLLTVVIQSSSAMLGITIALASSGSIGFTTAAALVLGENIGTTITALLASVGATSNAKRAARAHAFFNVFGVCVVMIFFPLYVDFVDSLVPGIADAVADDGSKPNIATHIATSHTLFNITASILFLPFLNYLARFVTWITPQKANGEDHHLVILGETSDILPATAIATADKEVRNLKDLTREAFKCTEAYMAHSKVDDLARVKELEEIGDNIQKEVTVYICHVLEKSVSESQSFRSQTMIKVADELESILDYLERIVDHYDRFKRDIPVSGPSHVELVEFFKRVSVFFENCWKAYDEYADFPQDKAFREFNIIKAHAEDLRQKHIERVGQGDYLPLSALIHSDIISALRKVSAHSMNLVQALNIHTQHNK